MQAPDSIAVTEPFRQLIADLADRLRPPGDLAGSPHIRVVAGPRWRVFAEACGLSLKPPGPQAGEAVEPDVDDPVIVVGPLAPVLEHARKATAEFGFVMPVAQRTKPWQREPSWRDDATLELWRAGWSPVDLDRIMLSTDRAALEFAIGNARPTPTVSSSRPSPSGASALDDSD